METSLYIYITYATTQYCQATYYFQLKQSARVLRNTKMISCVIHISSINIKSAFNRVIIHVRSLLIKYCPSKFLQNDSDDHFEEFTRLSILNKQEIPTDWANANIPGSSSFIDLSCSCVLIFNSQSSLSAAIWLLHKVSALKYLLHIQLILRNNVKLIYSLMCTGKTPAAIFQEKFGEICPLIGKRKNFTNVTSNLFAKNLITNEEIDQIESQHNLNDGEKGKRIAVLLQERINEDEDQAAQCLLNICDVFESKLVNNEPLRKLGASMRQKLSSKSCSETKKHAWPLMS